MLVDAFSAIYGHPAATQELTRVAGPPTSLPVKWKAWESRCGQEGAVAFDHFQFRTMSTPRQ
jgi:hypothetical protein